MGATNFVEFWEGADYKEGFRVLSREAELEEGYDPYNGTISTTSLSWREPKVISARYGATSREKAMRFVEKEGWEDAGKRYCEVLDLGVSGWEVSKFVKEKTKPCDVKYHVVYEVRVNGHVVSEHPTAAKANEEARRVVADPRRATCDEVEVRKSSVPVDGSGNAVVGRWVREVRIQKSKPSRVAKGSTVRAIHKWCYYGWAAC